MKSKARIVLVLLVVAAGATGLWYWQSRGQTPDGRILSSGTVEATDARLGFRIPGQIVTVQPEEGDSVAAGDLLATLDREELEAGREEAVAQLAAARAQLADLESGFRPEEIAQARAARDAANDRLTDAERDLERTRILFAGDAVSQEAVDKTALAREVAASQLAQAKEQLRLLETGHRPEQIAAAGHQVERAEAAVRGLDARLAETRLTAPFAGVVTVRHHEPGEVVAPGAPVLTLLDRDDRWIRIYVREDRIGAIHLGQRAVIRSDTYPDRTYPGEVFFVASEAEFTPKNVQTQEERVRLVYAVKVRVTEDPDHELKPGMPVDVEIRPDGDTSASGDA